MVKYYAKGSVYTVFFTPKEVVFSLFKPAEAGDPRSSLGQQQDRQPGLSPGPHSKFTRGKLPQQMKQTLVRMQPVGLKRG